jgi:hypothetical protein
MKTCRQIRLRTRMAAMLSVCMIAVFTLALLTDSSRVQAQAPAASGAPGGAARGRGPAFMRTPPPPLFFRETWHRNPGDRGQVPVVPSNLSDPNLELKVYGRDAKGLTISGTVGGGENDVVNLWSGLSSEPIAVLLRDKSHYVDLSGRAKIRWVIRTSGFHVVRPAIQLSDGTLLVGDHADSSTTIFAEREFAITDIRWIRLDPQRVVTVGTYGPYGQAASWYPDPDLSKVDAVGWVDLMPGSGHGSGGWINVGTIEVYGRPVDR